MSIKVNLVTLGCSKNLVDSEHLAGLLGKGSFKVTFDSSDTDFDVVIVNTCGFIGDAKEESVDTVLQFAHLRKSNRIKKLIVFGCLVQRYAKELAEELLGYFEPDEFDDEEFDNEEFDEDTDDNYDDEDG